MADECKSPVKPSTKGEYFKPINFILSHEGYKFKITKFLGRGAYAQVFEAKVKFNKYSQPIPEKVALKIVKLELITSKKAKAMLETELQIQKHLSHPNIVKMFYSFRDYEYVYMILEHCNEGALDKHALSKIKKCKSNITILDNCRMICKQLLDGMKYLHKNGIVHRDLKLGNIFIDTRDEMTIKIGDFGLAAHMEDNKRRKTVCGTPNYIAPEVLFGKDTGHSYEADIWSFGVIMYALLVGIPPFQEQSVKEIYERIKTNKYEFPKEFEENYSNKNDNGMVSTMFLSAQDIVKRILLPTPEARLSIDEILDHRFFNPNAKLNNKQSVCGLIYDNLVCNKYNTNPIETDHVILSFPMNQFKAIGYVLKSGVVGLCYYNKDHIYLYYNTLVHATLGSGEVTKYIWDNIPKNYQRHLDALKHYITTYTTLNWNDMSLPSHCDSRVYKMSRITSGYIFLMSSNVMIFDFNIGSRIVVSKFGKEINALDDDGSIEFSVDIKRKLIDILKENIHKRK